MPRRIVRIACALVAVAAVTAPNALASAIRVTTTADTPTAPGVCTLRDAVVASNTDTSVGGCAAGSGADVIQLHRGSTYTLSIPGRDEDASATGDLDVTGRLTINGKGATIDAGGVDRVLSVQETGSLDLSHITLRGGAADSSLDPGEGGALLNLGSTVLKAVTVTDNRAAEFTGGAVLNGGVLTISGSDDHRQPPRPLHLRARRRRRDELRARDPDDAQLHDQRQRVDRDRQPRRRHADPGHDQRSRSERHLQRRPAPPRQQHGLAQLVARPRRRRRQQHARRDVDHGLDDQREQRAGRSLRRHRVEWRGHRQPRDDAPAEQHDQREQGRARLRPPPVRP